MTCTRQGSNLMMILAVYFAKDSFLSRKGARFFVMLTCIIIAAGCLSWYLLLYKSYVIKVERKGDNPELHSTVFVSIGNVRSSDPMMVKAYHDKSDSEMLQNYGLTDDDIYKLYTRESVDQCRISLYLSFLLSALAFVAFGSFGVLFITLDEVAAKWSTLP